MALPKKAPPAYGLIGQKIENWKVAGGDETGAKVNGKKGWSWTFQGQAATYITYSNNRGTATINENFPNGFGSSILLHDCWPSYFHLNWAITNFICPHFPVDLKFGVISYSPVFVLFKSAKKFWILPAFRPFLSRAGIPCPEKFILICFLLFPLIWSLSKFHLRGRLA